jgi:hypothetical protein
MSVFSESTAWLRVVGTPACAWRPRARVEESLIGSSAVLVDYPARLAPLDGQTRPLRHPVFRHPPSPAQN